MQIEAIYEHGLLRFTTPVKLRRDTVALLVEIPENELVLPSKASDETGPSVVKTRDRLNAILGHWRYVDASGCLNYKAIWHAHLEDKYIGSR